MHNQRKIEEEEMRTDFVETGWQDWWGNGEIEERLRWNGTGDKGTRPSAKATATAAAAATEGILTRDFDPKVLSPIRKSPETEISFLNAFPHEKTETPP